MPTPPAPAALSGLRVLAAAAHTARPLAVRARAQSRTGGGRYDPTVCLADLAASKMGAAAVSTLAAQRAAPELAVLAVDIARALIGEAASRDQALTARLVSEALARFVRARRVLVRVHPEDVAPARRVVSDWACRVGAEAAEVVADASVSRGGAWVETERGRLDATLETRLAALQAALLGDAGAP